MGSVSIRRAKNESGCWTPGNRPRSFGGGLLTTLLLVAITGAPAVAADLPVLVRDLNRTPASSEPEPLGTIGGRLILVAKDGIHGPELWASDGTHSGTHLLREVRPGPDGVWTGHDDVVNLGDRIIFVANDGSHGSEPWVTDGTAAGTRLLRDVHPGPGGSGIWTMRRVGARAVILADDGSHGAEPWISDGTPAGTRMLKDIRPGRAAALIDLDRMIVVGDRLAFTANDGSHGWEPWISDGTPAGTRMVKDIEPGPGHSTPGGSPMVAVGDFVFFPAHDAIHGWEAWTSDGRTAGTRLVKDIGPGRANGVRRQWQATATRSRLLFAADDGRHGREPWSSDGMVEGTVMLGDLAPGTTGSEPFFGMNGDRAMIVAMDGVGAIGIWGSDGTPDGTARLSTVAAMAAGHAPTWWPQLDGTALFTIGTELWASDGTIDGTRALLTGVREWSTTILGIGRRLMVALDDGVHGMEPWVTDGTPANTRLVLDLHSGLEGSRPQLLASAGGRVMLFADDGDGREPWVTDGTPVGTRQLVDAWDGAGDGLGWRDPWAVALHGRFVFGLADRVSGAEPWSSDGSPAGTGRLRDILPGTQSSGIFAVGAAGDRSIVGAEFTDARGTYGRWLWRTDGSSQGTVRIAELSASVAPTYGFTPIGSRLHLFHADQVDNVTSLLVTDGTTDGTRVLGWHDSDHVRCARGVALGDAFLAGCGSAQWGRSVSGGLLWSDGAKARYLLAFPLRISSSGEATMLHDATDVVVAGDRAYFLEQQARILAHGRLLRTSAALWRSDGTRAGTRRIIGVDLGPVGSWSVDGLPRLVASGRSVVFAARDDEHGMELWISDGTAAGTHRGAEIRTGRTGSHPSALATVLRHVTLSADDGRHGAEPWIGDGDAGSMRLLKDVRPGRRGSSPSRMVEAGGLAFFSADDGSHGRELWVTDGTGPGTHLVRDIAPGPRGATPTSITRVGRIVYFVATDARGTELWRSDGTARGTERVADLWPGRVGSRPAMLTPVGDILYFVANDRRHGRELWRVTGR